MIHHNNNAQYQQMQQLNSVCTILFVQFTRIFVLFLSQIHQFPLHVRIHGRTRGLDTDLRSFDLIYDLHHPAATVTGKFKNRCTAQIVRLRGGSRDRARTRQPGAIRSARIFSIRVPVPVLHVFPYFQCFPFIPLYPSIHSNRGGLQTGRHTETPLSTRKARDCIQSDCY